MKQVKIKHIEDETYTHECVWFHVKYKKLDIDIKYVLDDSIYHAFIQDNNKNRKQKYYSISFVFYFKDLVEQIQSLVFGNTLLDVSKQKNRLKKLLYKQFNKYINVNKNMI